MAALLTAGAAAQTPDFSELNNATTNLLAVMENLQKELPSINTEDEAAKAIDSFTKAMGDLATAMIAFRNKYPEAVKGATPPPEFAASYKALSLLNTKYASVPQDIGGLARRFRTSPSVVDAMTRFQVVSKRFGGENAH
jgi:hypothetical protein